MRQLSFFPPVNNVDQWVLDCFREIENASREDVQAISDGFTVTNVASTTTLNPTTCTLPQLAQFVATFIDQIQRRGPSRIE